MANYRYVCPACGFDFVINKAIRHYDRNEDCLKCGTPATRKMQAVACHGLSDGPGTTTPNQPHKPIFDLVDTHNDSMYTYNQLMASGRLDKDPEMKRDIETHLNELKTTPREIVDYQKTGHDLEK